jgi:hypothetical protein
MNRQIRASIPAIAAAVTLVACASKPPVNSTEMASAGAQGDTPSEYQSLVDNASKQLVCRRTAVTGSRILQRQVCLTRAEIEARRLEAHELMREMQSRAAIAQPMPDSRPPSVPQGGSPGTP